MTDPAIEVSNDQLVGVRMDEIIVIRPLSRMSKVEALRHAAWLVALAEDAAGEFAAVLAAVRAT